ncbi:MAG: YdcH family protein [Chromatiales bacterium]|nr:YdcH family protein [Chromatiales bacterium]
MRDDPQQIRERLEALKVEHRDLDEIIRRLADNPAQDQLQVTRLKKRKLQLKDAIARLESRLIPDLNA